MRETLSINKKYILSGNGNKKAFRVTSVVGIGATCVVYNAYYLDDLDLKHNVRLKECCPISFCYEERGKDERVSWKSESDRKQAFENFEKIYKRHLSMQAQYAFVNVTSKVVDCLYEGNGTKYLVMECDNGQSFEKTEDVSLYNKLKILRALGNTIDKYHDIGWLHLDLKPENFMVIPETPELVKLFDFDSMVSMDALEEGRISSISFSNYWAAPEVKQGKLSKINRTSDIYSLGALLYYMVFDKKPDLKTKLDYGKYNYDNLKVLNNVNPAIKFKLTNFLKKTMAPRQEKRYQEIKNLMQDLNEMIHLADPSLMYLCSNLPIQSNYFVGRTEELKIAHNVLKDERLLIVTGIGGVGKTEFSQCYAKKHENEYSCIVWAKVETSIEKTILDDNLFNIAGFDSQKCSANEKLKILKNIVDSNTLIILDNIKNYDEEFLYDLLSSPCKFILTSRRASNEIVTSKNLLSLDCMGDEELFDVFAYYYRTMINMEDKKRVIEIIHKVGNYTLLIPIIAKQMYLSNLTPFQMLERINNTSLSAKFSEKVKHRKDSQLYEGGMMDHVANTFTWTEFSEEEIVALKVLAKLGNIKVSKKSLAAWCGFSTYPKYGIYNVFEEIYKELDLTPINNLIDKGVLAHNDNLERLEIHDVIAVAINNQFERNINSFGKFSEILVAICKGIAEWKEEYDEDFFWRYEDVNEYQIHMYLNVVTEFLENLDMSLKENATYVVDVLKRICSQCPTDALSIIKNVDESILDANEVLTLNRMTVECCFGKIVYRSLENYTEFENAKILDLNTAIDKATSYARKHFRKSKDDCLEYYLSLCEPIESLINNYGLSFFSSVNYENAYKKLLYLLNRVKKEHSMSDIIEKAENIRSHLIEKHKQHLEYERDKDKPVKTKKIEHDEKDILDIYEERFEKADDKLVVLEQVLVDPEFSISGKRWFLDNITFPDRRWFINHPALAYKEIENPEEYFAPEQYYYQRLLLKLYYNGFFRDEMPVHTFETAYENIITECALRHHYKPLLTYMRYYKSNMKKSGAHNAMFLSINLRSMCGVPEILERLNLHILANDLYFMIAKSCFSDEMIEELQGRWEINDCSIPNFLNSAMACAEKCMDIEAYRTYQKIENQLLHVDFSYGNINTQLRKGIMSEWNGFTDIISSSKPFEDKVSLINNIRGSNLLMNTAKEVLIDCINKPYDWNDVLSNPSVVNKGYVPNPYNLEELLLQYQNQQSRSLIEEISVVAGICFMSSVTKQDEICAEYMMKYMNLLTSISSSKVEFLALIRYELLASLWARIGDYKRSHTIYKHMYMELLSKRWMNFTYYESKLTKEIFDNMFHWIIAMAPEKDSNKYIEVQSQYEKLCKELELNWDESSLTEYC